QIHRAEAAGTASAFALVVEPDPRIVEVDWRIVGNIMASGIERRHSSAWVSYWIVAAARGAGLTSSALRSFVDQLHDGLGIHRLELGYRTNNPASAKVAKNAGFLVEGRDRKSTRLNSSHVSISYAVFCLKKRNQKTCSCSQ